MFKSWSLQTRMIAAFVFMGLIVLVVALIGWSSSYRLSDRIDALGNNTLPTISGVWKINEGQTQVQSSERALLNPLLSRENQKIELSRIKEAWKQIDEGFKEYNSAPRIPGEDQLYRVFLKDWERWKKDHQQFMRLYLEFFNRGISDPKTLQLQLLTQNKENSPEMAVAKAAGTLLNKLSILGVNEERISFDKATESILEIVKLNYEFATATKKAAAEDVSNSTFWVVLGMIVGPIAAVILGVYFSITIAKPLGAKIAAIVNTIVSSSTEISATVAQQEHTTTQQAASVNQTTTTMTELGASSQQSAEQAAAVTANARQVLKQVEDGTKAVEQTLQGMATLKQKVEEISFQIKHLSQQTNQIGTISSLVSELANQTNMLALNAAVEAVRAGEHGKGFGVVASEIRKLADQSKKSAENIKALVANIQTSINSTVTVTDEGSRTAEKGSEITQQTAAAFQGIAEAINSVFVNIQQISLNAKQQAVATQQVVEAMNSLNQAAIQMASGITQTKIGTQKLNEAALILKAVV